MSNHTDVAARLRAVAEQLRLAAEHALTAANHMDERAVPRSCAHLWATRGHVLNATADLDALAQLHAAKARP